MKTSIVLGSQSDIAQGLIPLLRQDEWKVVEWRRGIGLPTDCAWDLLICALGRVSPVGWWWEQDFEQWEQCIDSNLMTPFWCLQQLWTYHNNGASVCFMAGSNPNTIMDGYSAYNTSKMALLKLVEQIDHETRDAKFFALGPGTILTKIHVATIKEDWPNVKLEAEMNKTENRQGKIARVYECLKWCIEQNKEVIGGRNICVSDEWDRDDTTPEYLKDLQDTWKLRREEKQF